MSDSKKELRYYISSNGKTPAENWLETLKDRKGAAIIRTRLDRLAYGNPGDLRKVGGVVKELRIHFGPGYRVYFAELGTKLIILLCGGNKSTQSKDIRKAKEFWEDFRRKK